MKIITEDFEHGIGCPICKGDIDYIGNLDSTKEFEGNKVKVDETYLLLGEGSHTTEGYRFYLETIITYPTCGTKIKTDASTKILEQ